MDEQRELRRRPYFGLLEAVDVMWQISTDWPLS